MGGAGSVAVAALAALLALHFAAVLQSPVVGDLDGLADVGFTALQHLLLVQILVNAQRNQLGSGQPLPAGQSEGQSESSLGMQKRAACLLTPWLGFRRCTEVQRYRMNEPWLNLK